MQLKEFVKNTLIQISEGIKEAQEDSLQLGAYVNPRHLRRVKNFIEVKGHTFGVEEVNFEIGLTESEDKGDKKGIGVNLGCINVGAGTNNESQIVSATNVKFSVPICFPSLIDDKITL